MESPLDIITEKLHNASDQIEEIQNVGDTERIVSLIAGVLLSYYGMRKNQTMLGKGLAFAGGLLITRGTTGVCPVNKAIGRNSLLA